MASLMIKCKGPCGQEKPETAFRSAKNTKSGRMSTCKVCTETKKNVPAGQKYCSTCHELKAFSEFNKDPHCKGGVAAMCRICYNARHDGVERAEEGEKACTTCNLVKPLSAFGRSKHHKMGAYPVCKGCKAVEDAGYRVEHIEQKRAKDREYYARNAAAIKMRATLWLQENPARRMERFNEQLLDGLTRTASVTRYTDCSRSFLTEWLEFQFDEAMSWDNMGSYWSVDHVRPCNSFDFTDLVDVDTCFNWRNLRPLEKLANIAKGDHYTQALLDEHQTIVDRFLARSVPNLPGNREAAEN
jgi:hypothetical protein